MATFIQQGISALSEVESQNGHFHPTGILWWSNSAWPHSTNSEFAKLSYPRSSKCPYLEFVISKFQIAFVQNGNWPLSSIDPWDQEFLSLIGRCPLLGGSRKVIVNLLVSKAHRPLWSSTSPCLSHRASYIGGSTVLAGEVQLGTRLYIQCI